MMIGSFIGSLIPSIIFNYGNWIPMIINTLIGMIIGFLIAYYILKRLFKGETK
jgi:predicted membrane protein